MRTGFKRVIATIVLLVPSAAAQQVQIAGRWMNGPMPPGGTGGNALAPCSVLGSCALGNPGPGGTAWDGTHIWQGNYFGSAVIERIDPVTCQVVHTIPAPDIYVGALTWDGSALWASPEQSGVIHRVDPTTGAVLATIPAPGFGSGDPNTAGLGWDGQYLWLSDYTFPGTIYQIDPANGNIVSSYASPTSSPSGLEYCGGVLVLGDYGADMLHIVDAPTGNLLSSCSTNGSHPWGVAIASDGSTWNADGVANSLTNYGTGLGSCAGGVGTKYCIANNNSTGAPADLSASGSASSSAGDLTLSSAPVPNQNSIFFHGANQSQFPFGNGFMCTTGGIVRGSVVPGVGNVATYTYDNSNAKHSLAGFIGNTRNFQHWFRDPAGGGAFFNLSNAVSIAILP